MSCEYLSVKRLDVFLLKEKTMIVCWILTLKTWIQFIEVYCQIPFLSECRYLYNRLQHNDVIKWKHFPRYWHCAGIIYWSSVNSPHEGQWRRALTFFFDLRQKKRLSKQSWGWWFETHHAQFDVTIMNGIPLLHILYCICPISTTIHLSTQWITKSKWDWPPSKSYYPAMASKLNKEYMLWIS